MGISILVKWHLYIKMSPRKTHRMLSSVPRKHFCIQQQYILKFAIISTTTSDLLNRSTESILWPVIIWSVLRVSHSGPVHWCHAWLAPRQLIGFHEMRTFHVIGQVLSDCVTFITDGTFVVTDTTMLAPHVAHHVIFACERAMAMRARMACWSQ